MLKNFLWNKATIILHDLRRPSELVELRTVYAWDPVFSRGNPKWYTVVDRDLIYPKAIVDMERVTENSYKKSSLLQDPTPYQKAHLNWLFKKGHEAYPGDNGFLQAKIDSNDFEEATFIKDKFGHLHIVIETPKQINELIEAKNQQLAAYDVKRPIPKTSKSPASTLKNT